MLADLYLSINILQVESQLIPQLTEGACYLVS